MKKSFLFMLMILATVSTMRANNILVVYFSWGGNTQALAEEIQRQTGGDIYRIEPTVPYTTDYNTLAYTVARNEKDANARPALKETDRDFSQYNYIFVGCPVWWFDVPMIMHTFYDTYRKQLQGRTLIPFGTHEMSGIGGLVRAMQTDLGISGITYLQELGLIARTIGTADSQQQVETWLAQLGFSENR